MYMHTNNSINWGAYKFCLQFTTNSMGTAISEKVTSNVAKIMQQGAL